MIKNLIFLAILLSCMGCRKDIGPRVVGEGYEGVIVTAREDLKYVEGAWIPTKELVREIEKRLPAYVVTESLKWKNEQYKPLPPLSEYKRQYRGGTDQNGQFVKIMMFHKSVVKDGLWRQSFGIMGGGNHVLHVLYNVPSKQFVRMWANAHE